MREIPTFAVVGHPNKGKSSIVSTLSEDSHIAISDTPGTTVRAHEHSFAIDGVPQYILIDTPGFQRPGEVLAWLQANAQSASGRPKVVAEFVAAHQHDPRFVDECELLKPLIEGAGILYVVDATKPYGAEYELEMEILQWTGQPRMALMNLIGEQDFRKEWHHALDQYFSIVRVFDAMHADFETRTGLLRAFGELDESWRPALENAVHELKAERLRRRQRSAREIATALQDELTFTERRALKTETGIEAEKQKIITQLQDKIRQREQTCMSRVQALYRHSDIKRSGSGPELLELDLFTSQNWEAFGLSRTQLMTTGMLSGAVAGGGVDLLLGGASLMLGAAIGAVMGGAGAWMGSEEIGKVRILGNALGGKVLQVGPVKSGNLAWVLLGRAWVHHQLVAERNHAYRAEILLAVESQQNLMDHIPEKLRKRLAEIFGAINNGDQEVHARLVDVIDQLLDLDPKQETTAESGPGARRPHE